MTIEIYETLLNISLSVNVLLFIVCAAMWFAGGASRREVHELRERWRRAEQAKGRRK